MANQEFLNQRLEDMFLSADRRVSSRYTPFLDGSELAQAEKYIRSISSMYPQVEYRFWGGFSSAERKVLCVHSSYLQCTLEEFPIKVVELNYNTNFSKLTHRDFLGAIMSLNVTRNSIGDIVVGQGKTQVVVSSTVADIVLHELSNVGRLGVNTSIVDSVTIEVQQNFKDISGTVPSLRLDCILGLALNVSRSKALQIVKSNVVTVDYVEQTSPDYILKADDVFVVKGFGKYTICYVSEPTKKNRFHVLIKKYL